MLSFKFGRASTWATVQQWNLTWSHSDAISFCNIYVCGLLEDTKRNEQATQDGTYLVIWNGQYYDNH